MHIHMQLLMGNSSVTHVTFVLFFYFHWATIKHLVDQSNKFKAYDHLGVQLYVTTYSVVSFAKWCNISLLHTFQWSLLTLRKRTSLFLLELCCSFLLKILTLPYNYLTSIIGMCFNKKKTVG